MNPDASKQKYENEEIRFYRENNIAPSINEQEDYACFLEKRKKLYRQLGIPLLCLENKDVIEFGASCGENSLPLVTGFAGAVKGIRHIDIVEPNESGRNAIQKLFTQNDISSEYYTLYADTLESFSSEKKYDFIIAEQFLQLCTNWKECLLLLKNFAKPNSIIIVTCADTIGMYIEVMKRYVAQCMVKDIRGLDGKIEKLVELFEEYLNALKGMNKTHKDYVADQFFCGLVQNGAQMNMLDAINVFYEDFDVLGASQNIFTDYSWYKDLNYNYISDYKKQYLQKRHMFMFAGEAEETFRSIEENEVLAKAIERAIEFELKCEQKQNVLDIGKWDEIILSVTKAADNKKMTQFNLEFLDALKKINNNQVIELSKYPVLAGSFGKTSQYLSFVKKAKV